MLRVKRIVFNRKYKYQKKLQVLYSSHISVSVQRSLNRPWMRESSATFVWSMFDAYTPAVVDTSANVINWNEHYLSHFVIIVIVITISISSSSSILLKHLCSLYNSNLRQTTNFLCLVRSVVGYNVNWTRRLRTARGHMMPPPLHVCNGLANPADESHRM